jgi:hypothetical protein
MADTNHSNQFNIIRRSLFAFSTTGIMQNRVIFPRNGTSTAVPPIDPAVVIGAGIFRTTLSWIELSKGRTVDDPPHLWTPFDDARRHRFRCSALFCESTVHQF